MIPSNSPARTATNTRFTPTGDIAATDVQAAIEELDTEKASASDIRERLTASRTYYVRTDGSDSNTGLVNSSGGAFLTLQKAYDTILGLDLGGYDAVIQFGNSGTFTGALSITKSPVGGNVTISGSGVTAILSTTSANAISITAPIKLSLDNFEIGTTTSGNGVSANGAGAKVSIGAGMIFGACAGYHLYALSLAQIVLGDNYTINGAADRHIVATLGGVIEASSITVTVSGTPAFTSFVLITLGAVGSFYTITYSGSATGVRYQATLNGVINTYGGGASYFPGNSSGTTATGGQYA